MLTDMVYYTLNLPILAAEKLVIKVRNCRLFWFKYLNIDKKQAQCCSRVKTGLQNH